MDYSTRYEQRKKRRLNRLLNVAIGVVAILIIYFAIQLFFSSGSEEAIADHDQEEQQEEHNEENTEQLIEENTDIDSAQDETSKNEIENEELREEDEEEDEEEGFNDEVRPGDWQPIGTVQSEPFELESQHFSKDHVNWKEMTHAIQYATGLDDDITIWRIENGGNPQSAVGTVSGRDNKHTPYRVRIEWVPERGWKPVEVIQLSENPYLR
ncbi:YrrS family protein [Alkalihalobacterium alkalinitrilicum]|uniref:YrrS family protein n=1 Tax=Alkalihalobacterium alkalinitrilicum TaxID=427920 RepID=UPI0009952A34|nr:YrrS family protein [Alkalihalobacterium alkalinitrilicum]